MENETIENVVVYDTTSSSVTTEQLQQIHTDLGLIFSVLIVFVLFVLLKYSYKFFDMFFKI